MLLSNIGAAADTHHAVRLCFAVQTALRKIYGFAATATFMLFVEFIRKNFFFLAAFRA
jgi:hypothetical protein